MARPEFDMPYRPTVLRIAGFCAYYKAFLLPGVIVGLGVLCLPVRLRSLILFKQQSPDNLRLARSLLGLVHFGS